MLKFAKYGLVLLTALTLTACVETSSTQPTQTSQTETTVQNEPTDNYEVTGPASISPTDFSEESSFNYSPKDHLGRTQTASATITYADVEKSFNIRQQFKKGDDPSGWPKKNQYARIKTSTGYYNGYFWNRSHLIADSLGGDAVSENAITGTRIQNVGNRSNTGGMQYIERKAVDYLKNHQDVKLYYKATPKYTDNELIPRTVEVDALTSDSGLNEHVVVPNIAFGYEIDYNTGDFHER